MITHKFEAKYILRTIFLARLRPMFLNALDFFCSCSQCILISARFFVLCFIFHDILEVCLSANLRIWFNIASTIPYKIRYITVRSRHFLWRFSLKFDFHVKLLRPSQLCYNYSTCHIDMVSFFRASYTKLYFVYTLYTCVPIDSKRSVETQRCQYTRPSLAYIMVYHMVNSYFNEILVGMQQPNLTKTNGKYHKLNYGLLVSDSVSQKQIQ